MKSGPTPEEMSAYREKLREVDDRAAAIIAATNVEDALQECLIESMIDLPKSRLDAIFGGDRPLSTFSAKIRIAAAFDCISDEVYGDLLYIKDIRNVFAHTRIHITFETLEIREAVGHMSYKALADRLIELSPDNLGWFKGARNVYMFACQHLEVIIRAGKGRSGVGFVFSPSPES